MDSGWQAALRRRGRRLYTLGYAALAGFRTGRSTLVMPGAVVSREQGGEIEIGARTVIHRGAMLLSYGGTIRLGQHCSVNPYSVLYGHGGLVVGDHVRIAAHCVIVSANHGFALDGGLIADQPLTKRGVRIGNDVWLGAGTRVLDGAVIGDGCVVAAGAVVRGTLEPYGIYAGVPARFIKRRAATTTYLRAIKHDLDHAENSAAVAAS
jgi:carbonic anhydrase/acetyltransferase-like protein (isoleucine patch superfamily)